MIRSLQLKIEHASKEINFKTKRSNIKSSETGRHRQIDEWKKLRQT